MLDRITSVPQGWVGECLQVRREVWAVTAVRSLVTTGNDYSPRVAHGLTLNERFHLKTSGESARVRGPLYTTDDFHYSQASHFDQMILLRRLLT